MDVDHINFCCPVADLESARVKLTPFVPSRHAQSFLDASISHPELYRYLPFGPFQTVVEFIEWHESRIRSSVTDVLFAVIDKKRSADGSPQSVLAGFIGLLDMSPSQASTEFAAVITLPSFQRTHVTANAIGLLMHYCLDLPADGGLGLRRVQWKANAENLASIRVAEKMGFIKEGLLRWHWVLPSHKEGKKGREGDPVSGPGRDTVVLAVCWDDWVLKKVKVDALIEQFIL